MQRLKYLPLIVMAFMLVGCGQKVIETLNVPQAADANAPGKGSSIVILPFADYSYSDNLAAPYRRNLQISESLTDNLSAQGFSMPVQEDVFHYLANQKVIKLADYERNNNVSLTNELAGDWSSEMKGVIRHYLQQQRITQRRQVENAPGTHALTTKEITKMGRRFQADYIVRGRILEYRTRQEVSWEPWRRGLLPVVFGGTSQILYGFAGSDSYDSQNWAVSGGMHGALIGELTDWPMDSDASLFGSDGATGNSMIWAMGSAMLGKHANNSGRIDQAVVQLRMWVQDAHSGQVVWTNRASVRVSPESVLSDGQYDDLFDAAIEKGVSNLVTNFVNVAL